MKNLFLAVSCLAIGLAFNVQAQTTSNTQSKPTISAEKEGNTDGSVKHFGTSATESEHAPFNIEERTAKANEGNLEAELDLGYAYLYGVNGVSIDYKQALYWYEKAAAQNSPVALNNLGSLYFNGIGTKVNYPKAISYFEEAAKLGSDDAAVNLAIIYLGSETRPKDYLQKVYQFLEQAKENNVIAKYLLGYSYMRGFMVAKDDKKAFELIKTAADEGYDEAQLVLADFYLNGWGTPKNYNRAVQYLKEASAQGNATSIYMLGDIFSEGKIQNRDIIQAHIYYNIASVLGVKKAAAKRDELENKIDINRLLEAQTKAENYQAQPSEKTTFIRKTYGESLKVYVDYNLPILAN